MSNAGKLLSPGTVSNTADTNFSGKVVISSSGGSLEVRSAGGFTTQSLAGAGTAPVIAGVTHCVASAPAGHDLGGSFVLTTDGTSITAGTMATVTFGTPLAAAPAAVLVQIADTTSTVTNVATVQPTTIARTGFTITNTASTTASHTFLVQYFVVAS